MKAISLYLVLLSISMVAVAPVFAFNCGETTYSLEYGDSWALATAEQHVAIASGDAVLFFDLSVPAEPRVISEYRVVSRIDVMAWAGDTLLVGGGGLMHTIDVSDPASPQLAGIVDLPSSVRAIAVDGSIAYVTGIGGDGNQLIAIDVSNADHPFEVGRFFTPGRFRGITVTGGLAYIANSSSGLQIIDVSDPAVMTSISALPLNNASNVVVADEIAYLNTTWGETIFSIDVSIPAAPFMLFSTSEVNEKAGGGIVVVDDLLYVGLVECWECSSGGGITVYNIENPSMPVKMSNLEFAGSAGTLAQLGSHLVSSDWKRGLWVFGLEQQEEPNIVAHHDVTFDSVFAIEVQGDLAFLGDRGLRIVDLAGEGGPAIIASVDDTDSTLDVAVAQDLAVILDWNANVTLIDVEDPEAPSVLAQFEPVFTDPCLPYYCRGYDVALAGDVMVVATGTAGAHIIDVQDPEQPQQLASISSADITYSAAVHNEFLYLGEGIRASDNVSASGVLEIWDISNPAEPKRLAVRNTATSITGIVADDQHLFVLEWGGLRIFEISDPIYPEEIGWIELGLYNSIVVDGDVVYLGSWPGGVIVLDVSNRARPRVRGGHVWQPFVIADGGPLGGYGVAPYDDLVVVADGMWGLRVVDVTRCLIGPRSDSAPERIID